MTREDIPLCADEMIEAFKAKPWCENWTKEQSIQRFEEIFSSEYALGFVAVDERGKVYGTCIGHTATYLDNNQYIIDDYSVLLQVQGKGIGSKLFSFMKEECKKLNISKILLMTNTGYPSVKFYTKNGMKESVDFEIMEMNL